MSEKLLEIQAAVENGKAKQVAQLCQEALDAGENAADILNKAMIGAMSVVGTKFKNNEIFVPEMLIAARAMKKGVEVIAPALKDAGAEPIGKLIIGTVAGDLHDIGKNLVAMMIEGAGFEVMDLGVDVPKEKFIETLEANPDVEVVALSALLTTTMPAMKEAMEALQAYTAKTGRKLKVIVGGAPITQAYADEIGADAYSEDAAGAAEVAKQVLADLKAGK
ncbi:MAG: corrinoid protein [Oscillospiraceae bacterium]|jgi:corrinoid protein of di/trimethylamine methyltransferase|nr:corrinoid protein [Oscillospiraceae bacterium]